MKQTYLSDDCVDVLRKVVVPAVNAADNFVLFADLPRKVLVVIAVVHATLAVTSILLHGNTTKIQKPITIKKCIFSACL